MRDGIMQRVAQFVALAQEMLNTHYGVNFPNLEIPILVIGGGTKYLKIFATEGDGKISNSIFCFIDLSNGDLLKPATYKAPAKHARGNIFDDDYAMRNVGPYGVAYMDTKGRLLKPLRKE